MIYKNNMGKTTILGKEIEYAQKYEYIIAKNGLFGGKDIKSFKTDIRKDLKDVKGQIIYIYYFLDKEINILQSDNFVYIGRSIPKNQKTFERFMHEIYENNKASDKAKQFTLTYFYENDVPLKLNVFVVNFAKKIERELLTKHKKIFGYLPIANGRGE